jgi:adenylylsulfate kinase-like enzyme
VLRSADGMSATDAPPVLVIVVGPQASGKSTLSAGLAAASRADGETVALVELDQIASMALPTLPSWDVALEILASVTARWVRSGLSCVIVEGIGSRAELDRLRARAARGTRVLTVAVTTSLETAFDRAQRDPTRGMSKDSAFLSRVYESWPTELSGLAADVVVDSGALSVDQSISLVRGAIAAARAPR